MRRLHVMVGSGISFATAFVLLAVALKKAPKPVYAPDNIGCCARCRANLKARAGNRMFFHLLDDHRLNAEAATEAVSRAYRKIGDGPEAMLAAAGQRCN